MRRAALLALLSLILLIAGALPGHAKLVTHTLEYTHEGLVCEGYLAYDDAVTGRRPGILVVHQWLGLSDNERLRAEMLAGLGYTALAADVYGKGVRPADRAAAAQEAGKYYADRALFRARLQAALSALAAQPQVDPARLAAIGYCFGGGGALELARAGAPLLGAVSFHGSLATPDPADAKAIRGKLLVCHGAADPFVKPEEVTAFIAEMEAAGVDYQLVMYAGAVHAFTQRAAGDDPASGAAYNAAADVRSWAQMQAFFAEIFD